MATQLSEQLELLKNALTRKFDTKQIFVFGSAAYGKPDDKTEATRQKRLAQAIEWMAEGKPRNWKYMRKP